MYNRLAVNLISETQAARKVGGFQARQSAFAQARSNCYAAVQRRHPGRGAWTNASIRRLVDVVFGIADAALRFEGLLPPGQLY